jgi:hypothetical protein
MPQPRDEAASEQPRFLHRDVAQAYTTNPVLAVPREPEALTANEQAELTRRVHVEAAGRRRAAWTAASAQIAQALDEFAGRGYADRRIASGLRAVRRAAESVGRHVERLA